MTMTPDPRPDCRCCACLDQLPPDGSPTSHSRRIMVVCAICGNKRCPHAADHRYACTGSNAPNQVPRLDADPRPDRPAMTEERCRELRSVAAQSVFRVLGDYINEALDEVDRWEEEWKARNDYLAKTAVERDAARAELSQVRADLDRARAGEAVMREWLLTFFWTHHCRDEPQCCVVECVCHCRDCEAIRQRKAALSGTSADSLLAELRGLREVADQETCAWAVFCKPGSEFDYRVFTDQSDALDFWTDHYDEEGDPEEPEIIELIPRQLRTRVAELEGREG